jgi:hypothetical protein
MVLLLQLCPPPSDVEGWEQSKTSGFDHAAVNHLVCVRVLALSAALLANHGRLVFLMPSRKGVDVRQLLAVALAAAGPRAAACLRLSDLPIPKQEFQNIERHCVTMHCVRG